MAKKQIDLEVSVPEGIQAAVEGRNVTVSGKKGSLSREFAGAKIEKKDNSVVIKPVSDIKRDRAIAGSIRAHLKNMIKGVSGGFSYKMKVVYSHFPMNVKVQGKTLLIDNFLGEKHPRSAVILDGVSVEVKGQDVTVSGSDREKVGQTAANIEQATRIKDRDPRVFQDGIYIIEKDSRPIK